MNRLRTSPEESATLIERQRMPRTLRVLAVLTGFTLLTGCIDSSAGEYLPGQDDTCTIVEAMMIEPGYEADRWSDKTTERERLEEQINSSLKKSDGSARYAICVDDKKTPQVANVDRIAYLRQFFGTDDHGLDIAGLSAPTIITPEQFEDMHQTEIDPGHGF